MLSLVSSVMTSCLPSGNSDSSAEESAAQVASDSVRNFKATGNEPFWGLWINADSIQFKSLYKEQGTFNFPYSTPETLGNGNAVYRSRTSAATIAVEIQRDTCVDTMSGHKSPYKVTLEFQTSDGEPTTFEGCGTFEGEALEEEKAY